MKILLTGVTGFVGGHLLRFLCGKKRDRPSLQLLATGRRPQLGPEIAPWAGAYFQADLAEGCPPVSADVCIHAAGLADDRSSALELHRGNVVATRNLLEALQHCRLFVFISSASVYGVKDGPLLESDATAESPRSEYGRSKWEAEEAVREICRRRGIACVILRPRAIYGPGDRVLLPRLMRLMRPPFLFLIGNGMAPVSLTYVGHLAAVIATIVLAEDPLACGTFNVADAEVYRLRSVLAAIYAAIHRRPPRVICIPVWLVRAKVAVDETLRHRGVLTRQALEYLTEPCVLDCTPAREAFDYAPSTTFTDHAGEIGQAVRDSQEMHEVTP